VLQARCCPPKVPPRFGRYHVDLVAWHCALPVNLYCVHPFAAFQDTACTASTLVARRSGKAPEAPRGTRALQIGGGTRQSWEHVFQEPLLKASHRGPLVTVGRHQVAVGIGTALGLLLSRVGGTAGIIGRALLLATPTFVFSVWATVRALVRQGHDLRGPQRASARKPAVPGT